MKKILLILLAAILTLTFAACNKSEKIEETTAEPTTAEPNILDMFGMGSGEASSDAISNILGGNSSDISTIEDLTDTIVEPKFQVALKMSDCEGYLGEDVKKTTDESGRITKIEKLSDGQVVADITYDYSKNIVDVKYYNNGETEYEMISFTYSADGTLDTVNHTYPGEAANGLKAEQYKYNPDGTIAYYISPEKINEVILQAIIKGLAQ